MDGLQHPSSPPLLPRNRGEARRPPYLRCLEYLPRMCPEPEHPGVGQLGRQAERSLGEGPTPDLTRGQKLSPSCWSQNSHLQWQKTSEITPPRK